MYNKLYIYFYDLYSPVASFFLCMCVRAFVERERATMNKQYASLPDTTWEGTLDLFGYYAHVMNFMCVCVCVYTRQFMYNKL